MKKGSFVVILGVVLSLMLVSCMQQITPGSEQGFLVRIAPSGEVISAVKWDGSELRYAPDEKKRMPGAKLALFTQGAKVPHYLKKVNGKWKSEVWEEVLQGASKGEMADVAQGIIVHVAPEGNILRVTNFDGSEVPYSESIDFTNARIATKNYCCWRNTPSGAQCLCNYCPWGCR